MIDGDYPAFKCLVVFVNRSPLSACVVNSVCCAVCNQWITLENTFHYNNYPLYSAKTLAQCKQRCVNMAGCEGVVWKGYSVASPCRISGTVGIHGPDSTYYKLVRACPAPASNKSRWCSGCLHCTGVYHTKSSCCSLLSKYLHSPLQYIFSYTHCLMLILCWVITALDNLLFVFFWLILLSCFCSFVSLYRNMYVWFLRLLC